MRLQLVLKMVDEFGSEILQEPTQIIAFVAHALDVGESVDEGLVSIPAPKPSSRGFGMVDLKIVEDEEMIDVGGDDEPVVSGLGADEMVMTALTLLLAVLESEFVIPSVIALLIVHVQSKRLSASPRLPCSPSFSPNSTISSPVPPKSFLLSREKLASSCPSGKQRISSIAIHRAEPTILWRLRGRNIKKRSSYCKIRFCPYERKDYRYSDNWSQERRRSYRRTRHCSPPFSTSSSRRSRTRILSCISTRYRDCARWSMCTVDGSRSGYWRYIWEEGRKLERAKKGGKSSTSG